MMAEKAINEIVDRQRDFIIFLEQILNICIIFKEKLDLGYKQIFFRGKSTGCNWYKTGEKGWSNKLFCCVYDAVISDIKALEISETADTVKEIINIGAGISIDYDELPDNESADLTEEKISNVIDLFQRGFADSNIVDRLKKDSEAFFSIRRQLSEKQSVFRLEKSDIADYLGKYYDLLIDSILFYDAFDRKADRDTFIGELLRLDSFFDEKSGLYRISFWSPVALNKLQKVNNGIEAFFKEITDNKAVESKWMREIYKSILLTKAQHDFRWYIPSENQELLHAAIATYVDSVPSHLKFEVIARSLKKYNSYEGIGELRLAEKIIYEYKLSERKSDSEFSVAIMGDLHAIPIEELYLYVNEKLGGMKGDSPIRFYIYTGNEMSEFENPHIGYCGPSRNILLDRNKLGEVIDKNNIVFILDCVELYKSPLVERVNLEDIKYKYFFSAYDEYNTGLTENEDVCDLNMLEELYEIMTCEHCFNQFGRISKQANDLLLDFCEEKQREGGKDSSIYVYVSDLKAFDNIYNDEQYYIRTERYNQKEIGIVRYSSEKVTKLNVGNRDRMLVFNIWQFIKHVAINRSNMFISHIDKSEFAYMALDRIYIGIDYSDWSKLLKIHYYSEEKQLEQVAVRFIKEVFLSVLNNHRQDMFNNYIRKSMSSFFYSSCKSVNDMLFLHLFQDKGKLLGKAVLATENNREKVKDNINYKFKYSSKRFYDMIMKNYDISSNIYIGQRRTSQIIQKSEQINAKICKNEIYENVMKACKNLLYEDGYLFKNCAGELG